MLNALSSALFTLVLRSASEVDKAPEGLLALAGHPRLAPAIAAMFADPARPWKLPELAELCGMSRATFMRQFQDRLGRSALDFLTDLRMSLAANELRKPAISTEAVAETVGYQSVSAFRHVFTQRMGMTPGGVAATGPLRRAGHSTRSLILSRSILSRSGLETTMHPRKLGSVIT